ncbi:MAG: Nif3-like dinuclear metal center hexameric protein [Marinisporobacter sp.]|jgi:dinuclear metal center YbgI/SA1388 family protein|nr:Nif3-like dinuclear metal center hexameric protein [Marinisporobacter sp.]
MAEKLKTVLRLMEDIAPSYLAEKWDNVGLQIGNDHKEIQRILVTLEVTDSIIDEAIAKNVDMIICHHPLIFKSLKKIRTKDPIQNMVYRLIKNDIALFCAHTNLDIVQGGTNDVLAETLNIMDTAPLREMGKDNFTLNNDIHSYGLGRVGELTEPKKLATFCQEIKSKLSMKHVRIVGDLEKNIQRIGLCTGSGAEFIYDAYKQGCDCYITGDIKYHDAQYAMSLGIAVIDAGHFETEELVCKPLFENLKKLIGKNHYDMEVLLASNDMNPFQII